MIDLESTSPNNPEQGTLLATQTPLRNVVEDLVAGVREENNLQHSLTTYGCLQEVPDYQEPTVVLNTPVNTKDKIEPPTIGENPRQSTVNKTTFKIWPKLDRRNCSKCQGLSPNFVFFLNVVQTRHIL